MPNNHAVVNTMHCTCWDVDAYKGVGVAASDMDNGQFVSLGSIAKNGKAITGYQFTVTAPASNATGLWMIRTPIPGTNNELDTHFYADPRYFYNKAGEPMSLCYMNPGVDVIEITADGFATGAAPTDQPSYTFASVGTDGKLAVAQTAPAQGTYFAILGEGYIDIGQEIVTTYVLKCMRN